MTGDMPTASYSRHAVNGPLHTALHELDVRIAGLPVDGCHCNLVTEVILDALGPWLDTFDRVRSLTYNTDGDPLHPDAEIPVGEVQRMLGSFA